jgi:hypothetical protein
LSKGYSAPGDAFKAGGTSRRGRPAAVHPAENNPLNCLGMDFPLLSS